jgi:hypothetical protein
MCVADVFFVHLFPDDIPVNIANPSDLCGLISLFSDKKLYMVVGSDVIANATSYRPSPAKTPSSLNHIIFSRSGQVRGARIRRHSPAATRH